MILNKDIKAILAEIPNGTTMHITKIQDYIGCRLVITS